MSLKRMIIAAAAAGLLASSAAAGTANAAVHVPSTQAAGNSEMHTAAPLVTSAPETFQNKKTGRCITAVNAGFIEGFGCSHEANEEWIVTVFSDGTRMFQNELTGTCMAWDGPGTVGGETCDTRVTAQHWFIDHIADGTIRFQNAHSFGCLRDRVPTQLGLTSCNDSFNQRFF